MTVMEWLVGVLDPLIERLSEWAFAEPTTTSKET